MPPSSHQHIPSRHGSVIDNDVEAQELLAADDAERTLSLLQKPQAPLPPKPAVASWANLPHKGQLAILAASRFVDFFQMAALQTYMVHQLRAFDPSLPDSVISHQAGVLQGAFTASQIVSSVLLGRAADVPWIGRKNVLLVGLAGTGFTMIGVGFSTSFAQATFWRVLGGAVNGTVGSARTMVAETVEKPWHSRAFLLLPVAFNVANIFGPLLSGMLVDPFHSFPKAFGAGSYWGGEDGVQWMIDYPFALPNLLSAVLLLAESLLVAFCLRETLDVRRYRPSQARIPSFTVIKRCVVRLVNGRYPFQYSAVPSDQNEGLLAEDEEAINMQPISCEKPKIQQRLPFRRIWTFNVLMTLLSIAVFDFHMGAFNNLLLLFLSTERSDKIQTGQNARQHHPITPFKFAGGLQFDPGPIGVAMAIIGVLGLLLQLLLYPWANQRFGLMRCFRGALFLFPLAYFFAPYISLLPSWAPAPRPASGPWIWSGISSVLALQVAARTFALPASIILLNNCCPHPSVLATIHGLGQSVSASFRTLGPIAAGYWYSLGLKNEMIGLAWWAVAGISAAGCVFSFWVRNGSGHEIFLSGEEKDEN